MKYFNISLNKGKVMNKRLVNLTFAFVMLQQHTEGFKFSLTHSGGWGDLLHWWQI